MGPGISVQLLCAAGASVWGGQAEGGAWGETLCGSPRPSEVAADSACERQPGTVWRGRGRCPRPTDSGPEPPGGSQGVASCGPPGNTTGPRLAALEELRSTGQALTVFLGPIGFSTTPRSPQDSPFVSCGLPRSALGVKGSRLCRRPSQGPPPQALLPRHSQGLAGVHARQHSPRLLGHAVSIVGGLDIATKQLGAPRAQL